MEHNFFTKTKKNIVKNNIELPWIEKYRPQKIKDIILDDIVYNKVKNIILKKEISNIIINGVPGTGKTSTILCIAKNLYKEKYNEAIIELNASDNRGLDIMNNMIIHFCKKKIDLPDNLPKLVILDEADNITTKAQNTLINFMDKYKDTTKFAYTCNDSTKLIEAIQSRCLILKYNKINNTNLKNKLIYICSQEKINYSEDALDTIISISNGDVRKAINSLEITHYGFNEVSTDNIYKICEKPSFKDINNLIELILNKHLKQSINKSIYLRNAGYSNSDILITLINVIKKHKFKESKKIILIDYISECFIKINEGIDTELQLLNCICGIYKLINKN